MARQPAKPITLTMPTFSFQKLVRNKIVQIQEAEGATPIYRVLENDDHRKELLRKLEEEVAEVREACNSTQNAEAQILEEIADVQQVLDDLVHALGLTKEEIEKARQDKEAKSGGFDEGIYIETVEIPEDNKWVGYYRKNSERYPETNC